MPSITSEPPPATKIELTALRRQITRDIPKKTDRNLLIATWNIREFGGLTDKWRTTENDKPKRDLHSLACITEIVSRFDVVAIQEVLTDIRALRHMLKGLGDRFSVILTDAVEDQKGDNERLAFVFDRSRVEVSGLACELVVPLNWTTKSRPKTGIPAVALDRQFARAPYAVAFKRLDTGPCRRRPGKDRSGHRSRDKRPAVVSPSVTSITFARIRCARGLSWFPPPPPPPPDDTPHGHGSSSQAFPSPSESRRSGSLFGPPRLMK
jgi:hypothetical protein